MSAYHWFNSKTGPEMGALVREDGSVVHVDFRNHADTMKVRETADQIGLALRNNKTGSWSAQMRHPFHGGVLWTVGTFETAEGAAADLLGKARAAVEAEAAVVADPVAHLERELERHDWYSVYSDDHSVWAAGERHITLIMDLMKQVPEETAKALFAKYAPADTTPPTV